MLGYYKDKKVFVQGDLIKNQIRMAVSKSGGTIQHYNMFNHLINYSIWNETLEAPIHDTRAAQCLLFIFPPAIRIFLSLVLYKEELNIRDDYINDYNLDVNIKTPDEVIKLSSIVNKAYISPRIYRSLENLTEDFILDGSHLNNLRLLLNIKESISFNTKILKDNLNYIFNVFNFKSPVRDKFITIAYTNNRKEAAVALCNSFNYKPKSTTLILQTIERWQLKTSNT